MRDPLIIARTWFAKANQTDDHYDRFVCLWFALNALYNEFLTKSEMGAIGDLVYSRQYSLRSSQIEEILNTPGVDFFKDRVIRNCRGNGLDTSESVVILKSKVQPLSWE